MQWLDALLASVAIFLVLSLRKTFGRIIELLETTAKQPQKP
jgi:hypothetical protein